MSKLRIVIADDESLVRLDLREMLEEAGHLVVGEASNGQQAIEVIRAEKPDIVIMDVKMPVLDGLETTKVLSDLGYPVLLLTAFDKLSIIERAKKVGAINYLVKPVSEQDVLPAVEMTYALHLKLASLRREAEMARRALDRRKIIEKACSAYARKSGLDHDEAYHRMAKLAMDKNKPLYQLAGEILKLLSGNEMRMEKAVNM